MQLFEYFCISLAFDWNRLLEWVRGKTDDVRHTMFNVKSSRSKRFNDFDILCGSTPKRARTMSYGPYHMGHMISMENISVLLRKISKLGSPSTAKLGRKFEFFHLTQNRFNFIEPGFANSSVSSFPMHVLVKNTLARKAMNHPSQDHWISTSFSLPVSESQCLLALNLSFETYIISIISVLRGCKILGYFREVPLGRHEARHFEFILSPWKSYV